MIDTPQIVQLQVQPIALIRLVVPMVEMRKVMGPGLGELLSTLKDQGITPSGPWLNHHFKSEGATVDFEIAVPVTQAVKETRRVKNGTLPAAKVARTIYHGPYEGLPAAWPQIDAWIVSQGAKPADELWQTYVAGPVEEKDPALYRTELTRPLLG